MTFGINVSYWLSMTGTESLRDAQDFACGLALALTPAGRLEFESFLGTMSRCELLVPRLQ
jgi:hypothetical protein